MAGNIENELNQLKEQIKLLERMVYLKNNVSSSEEYITKYMETQAKLSNMMKNYNMDSYNHEKKLLELLKQKAEIEEKRAKSAKERASAEKESIKNNETLKEQNKKIVEQNTEIIRQEEKYAKVRAAKRVNEALSSGSKSKAEQQSDARKTFAMNNPNLEGEALKKALIKNKLVDSETSSYMKDILKSFKVGNKNVGDYVNMNEKGISSAAQLLNVGVQTFNEAVKVFSNAVSQGFKNQTQNYENNFTNIAVRTGMTKDTYRSNQMSLGGFGTNILHERGLMNNIRTSEVQDMWNSLANTGMSQSDILASSLESVITKTIVPYLDITTDEMQQFNQNVGDNGLLKQVRGITKVSNEMFGGSQVATKYLQEQLEYLAPMSKVAEIDLVENTAEGMLALQGMRQSGMSDSAIAEILKDTRMLQEDHFGALTSGKMPLSLGAFEAEKNGVNTYEDFSGSLQSVLSGYGQIQNFIPTNSSMQGSIVSSAYGTKGAVMYELAKLGLDYDSIIENAKKGGKKVPQAGQEVTNSLAGDEFHTTRQLTDILAENLTNEVSAFAEMLGPWFDVLTTAVKGIAGILGVKLIGKVGGKILGGIGGSAGKHAASGGLLSTVGGNLAKASGGTIAGSSGLATAVGAAGVTAGVAGAVYGVSKGVGQLQEGETGLGITNIAGGAAMGVGAGLLLASNPIGWAVGAVGGIALAGAAIYEAVEKHNEAMEDSYISTEREIEKEMKKRKNAQQEEIDNLEYYQDIIKDTSDVEYAKKLAIEAGIATEEELKNSKYDEITAVNDLIDAYINNKKKINNETNNVIEELKKTDAKNKNKYKNGARDKMEEMIGGWGWNKEYHELSEEDRAMAVQTANAIWDYVEKNGEDKLSDEQKEIYNEMKKYSDDFENNSIHDNWDAMDKIIDMYDKHNDEALNLVKTVLNDDDVLTNFVKGDRGKKALKSVGIFDNYVSLDEDTAGNLVESMLKSGVTDKEVRGYLDAFKVATNITDIEKLPEETKKTIKSIMASHNITSYRVGTDSIPYDNYPALLHEGEAVLTASTANELRGLVDEYRATKEDNIKLEKAIQDQTNALVTRLDAIYNKIGNPDNDTSIMPRKIRQWKSNGC